MKNLVLMTVLNPQANHPEDYPYILFCDILVIFVKIIFQCDVHHFHYQAQKVVFNEKVSELHDIGVVEVLQNLGFIEYSD